MRSFIVPIRIAKLTWLIKSQAAPRGPTIDRIGWPAHPWAVSQQRKGGDPMSNGLVRLLAATLTLGSIAIGAAAFADEGCFDTLMASTKEKPAATTAEAPQPSSQPGS